MIWREYGYGIHFLHFLQTVSFMSQEIINYPFDPELDDDDSESSVSADRVSETNISYVNGHNLPEDDEDKEDDLILGDEDEIDVEVDDDLDAVVSDDDLVLDIEDDVLDDDEEEDDL